MSEGIRERHSRSCASRGGARCDCRPSFEAAVYSRRDGKKIRRVFRTLGAARRWRIDARAEVQAGLRRAPTPLTLREAAGHWLPLAGAGVVPESGDRHKPSTLRGYEAALRLRVLPELGAVRLSEIIHDDLRRFVGRLRAEDLKPSTIRNMIMPVRCIYRDAALLPGGGSLPVNPTAGLKLPKVGVGRDRIAAPAEAALLIAAAPARDRPVWATAVYSGLRLGELAALRWEDVDLAQGLIRVQRAFDYPARMIIAPKSAKGRRRVPIAAVLRDVLLEHRMRAVAKYDETLPAEEVDKRLAPALVFGRTAEVPFGPSGVRRRAQKAWVAAGLEPIGLHECRHSFASLMIAAGVNAKALSSYLGHASISVTFDRYGHLMPGNEEQAGALLDAFLEQALEEAARAAGGERAPVARP